MSSHNPIRPDQVCGGCGQDWPCEPRRRQLLAEYMDEGPTALRVFMALRLADAVTDLPHAVAAELFDRFLAWIPGALPPSAWKAFVEGVGRGEFDLA